ncbi:spermidine/putrescine ABC transporter permease [Nesterenkonia muleiensis]|uniref:spermidine/putrescine ABC transporter permease n=1 Tax=Nesterenkonia muleiensis TaxID=2282648 RepID=UPI001300AA67|nr:spermidine/putrescine ABC transporter permease [Nesterenkonia muleiensis]
MSLPLTQPAGPGGATGGNGPGGRSPAAVRPPLFSRERWKGVGGALCSPAALSLLPLGLILLLFFILPIVGMAIIAFTVSTDDGGSTVGLDNFIALTSGSHSQAVLNSVQVSLVGSAVAAVVGTLTAFCIAQIKSKKLDSVVAVFSSVLANDGGAPLAFSFIVTLGNAGIIYAALNLEAIGFSLYSWQGLVVMYQYFLIPTMVMVTLPTFVGIRKEWREANAALGGSAVTFWTRVGLPIAMPALLGGWILCFGAAFATHASAAVLIGAGGFPLIPLSISSLLGQSPASQPIAMALGVTMVVIAVVVLFGFNRLQRRSARWVQ